MTINIGIIGTGWFGMMHAAKLAKLEDVRVAAFTATNQLKADTAAKSFSGAKGFDDVAAMLESCKLDAVYVCVPPFAHGRIEEELIERGIPFLVEKPLGVNSEIPEQLLAKIENKGLITSVGYHFRYMDSTLKAKQLLGESKLAMAAGSWMGGMPGVAWWRAMELSGGQFVEQTTHIVDLLRFTAGEVSEVYAAYGNRIIAETSENADVPDIGSVILKLESGAVATISNTCAIPAGSRSGLQLYTSKGVLELSSNGLIQVEPNQRMEYSNHSDPYVRENEAFLHAVRTGDSSKIMSPYKDAWQTHRVTMAANESARTGLPVKL
ncbi:Gfo/Idh/MocA family oxidoreductase [Paenibacillus sp. HB172176]|uniref:Gfo/Idh/MocA family protein n=1 Tax=Paenibacillus sp. HB172176 TaxID=2493690 RepID=UPI001439664E|nr:Gfo/Idh/MocA family oxidoreductase [Paenibacillus sp. HB172176]